MIRQVTVTDLQRRAAEVIESLADGPVVVSQRGRPAAVLLTAQAFERIEQALEEHEAKRVVEIIEEGLASHKAGRTATHAVVARRMRRARARRK